MIGAFARKFGGGKRVHEIVDGDEAHAVTQEPGGLLDRNDMQDNLPENFVERVPTEGGVVVAVPLLDMMRTWARKVRRGEER